MYKEWGLQVIGFRKVVDPFSGQHTIEVVKSGILDHFITEYKNNVALYVDNDTVKVFATQSDQYAYAMTGYIYTLDKNLNLVKKDTLFSHANWGWSPRFVDEDTIEHFSFAGYYRMRNTQNIGSESPEKMLEEYNEERINHSSGLLVLNGEIANSTATAYRIVDWLKSQE